MVTQYQQALAYVSRIRAAIAEVASAVQSLGELTQTLEDPRAANNDGSIDARMWRRFDDVHVMSAEIARLTTALAPPRKARPQNSIETGTVVAYSIDNATGLVLLDTGETSHVHRTFYHPVRGGPGLAFGRRVDLYFQANEARPLLGGPEGSLARDTITTDPPPLGLIAYPGAFMADITMSVEVTIPPDLFAKANTGAIRRIRTEVQQRGGTSKLRRFGDVYKFSVTAEPEVATVAVRAMKAMGDAAKLLQKPKAPDMDDLLGGLFSDIGWGLPRR